MKNPKLHDEFRAIDMSTGWETPAGYPQGIQQKILAGSLDERGGTGNRSRLLRFAPGVYTTKPFVHDYWEEVLLISGSLIVGNDENGNGGELFFASDLRMPAGGRPAWSVQIGRRLSAVRAPLLRLIAIISLRRRFVRKCNDRDFSRRHRLRRHHQQDSRRELP